MIFAIAATIATFLVIAFMMGRQTKRTKQAAIEDLKREKEELAQTDIFALVMADIEDLGLRSIDGAADLQPVVLLKTWRDNSDVADRCSDRTHLRFIVTDGVEPATATADDVTLICGGASNGAEADADRAGGEDDG